MRMLKMILLVAVTSVAGLTNTLQGQNYPESFFKAVASNDGQVLLDYLDENVDLAIMDHTYYATEVEASTRILNWVKTHKVSTVKRLHKGENTNGTSSYHVATAQTSDGKVRIMVYSEKVSDQNVVKEIRIEKY